MRRHVFLVPSLPWQSPWKHISSNGKTYQTISLRESYRENGKVKKRDIANLTHCDPAEISAIELALKHKAGTRGLLHPFTGI